jgi:hypothetical protein
MKILGLENENQQEIADMKARLSGLMEKAPSDASATLLIRKDGNNYSGLLKIRSLHNKFVSACRAPDLTKMIDSIIRDTKRQIDEWKKERVNSLSYSS